MEKVIRDCLILLVCIVCLITQTYPSLSRREIAVGVILDLDTSLGEMARACIEIGFSDFNITYDSYSTIVSLHFRNSKNDVLRAAEAARDLIENEKVHAILGPQNSEQARFIVELGNKSNVPVIWFSPSGPSLLPPRSRFFINSNSNSTKSLCLQFKAIAAIIEAYGWQCVIPVYEEPEFGNDLIPCLNYVLQEKDTRIPFTIPVKEDSLEDNNIKREFEKMKNKSTCVFLAHMSVELWSKFVEQAQSEGMMSEGYAWIVTQALSSAIDPKAKNAKVYMEGFLGVRPALAAKSNITRIERVVVANTLLEEYNKILSLYGLWAYDTITALAYAVEQTSLVDFNGSKFDNRSETGLELRNAIQDTDFTGLSGNFNLGEGQLKPSQFEVYNEKKESDESIGYFVVYNVKNKRDEIIGFWGPERGLFPGGFNKSARKYVFELSEHSKYKLRDPIWPGNTNERPPKLRIGIPNAHFAEFVSFISEGNDATGFAVDVFKKVVHVLPFNFTYGFKQVNNSFGHPNLSSYEHLLCNSTDKDNFDIIIGDITVLVNRTDCADFSMPYLDSSVSMVVKVMSESKNGLILFNPFHLVLWLIICVTFVAATVAVLILEKPKEKKSTDTNSGSQTENDEESKYKKFVRNPFLIYLSDILSLRRRTSKWVVLVVMFLLTIVVQVYTSNLTPMLSERITAKPSPWKDVQEIKRKNDVKVGYQSDSWVKDFLIYQIGLDENRLKPLQSIKEYMEELSKGAEKDSKNGVGAIFDETPYLTLLLSQCQYCKMAGPIYKTGGFAFAFPKNSTLVSSFSAAIINITQNVTLFRDMKKNISLPIVVDRSDYKSEIIKMRGLTKDDFGGLFPIVYSILAIFLAIAILKAKWFQDKWIPFC